MEQLPSRALAKHVEPSVFGLAQFNPQDPFRKHAEPSLCSRARLAGTANNAKLDYSLGTRKHLALIRSSLSGCLQITRAVPSRKGYTKHLMRTENFEDNVDENGSIGCIASLHTFNEDNTSMKQGNADGVEDISMSGYFSGQGGANHEEPQHRAFEDYHFRQGTASHVKPSLRAFEDFRSKLDLKNWDNRNVGGKVYLDGKYYDMGDPSFIKLRNSNFLKFSSKALAKKYKIDESSLPMKYKIDDSSLVESRNQSSGCGPVVFLSDNDFYRQADFNTNVDLQQKLASLSGASIGIQMDGRGGFLLHGKMNLLLWIRRF